jgi:DNA-binding response OmpR family regulator
VTDLRSILVVEDESAARDLVIRMLSEKGFGVLTADTAEDALRILEQRSVDLLFSDIVLPRMDGVELAKQARLLRPGLKVLFATGYAQEATQRDATRVGKVLNKPLRAAELLKNVRALLATPRA